MTDQKFATPQEALAHFGVKGMKWGVRNANSGSSGPSRKEAKADVRDLSSTARGLIRESRRAPTAAERKNAAKKYESDVLERVKTPEFKAAYQKASTMGKGEMTVHALVFGPLALVTIPAMRKTYKKLGESGYELEIDTAHEILREMRS